MKSNYAEFIQAPIFKTLQQAADELGVEAYVIGGFVRDKLLDRREPKDLDVVAIGSGIALAKKVASLMGGKRVSVFKNFGTAQIKTKKLELEFVGARKESYQRNSRKPIVEDGTLEDDQNRRDFTINALALGLNENSFGVLLDPFNGVIDLENGVIRTPLDPDITFSDDPLRMLRAVRFANQLGFEVEAECFQALKRNANRLEIISKERIIDELHKIMRCDKPSIGLKLLFQTKLLHQFLPEIVALQGVDEVEGQLHKDNFYHTLEVVDNISRNTENMWLRYAALFHDIGKPVTKRFQKGSGWTFHNHEFVGSKMVFKIFKRLKLPLNDKLKYVQKIVRMSSRPIAITNEESTDSAARRLLFDAGDDLEDLMKLCEADITTKNDRKKQRFLKNFEEVRERLKEVEEKDQVRNFQPPIDGAEIMELFNLSPGREVGMLKNAIKEGILEGEVQNDYESAKSFLITKAEEFGLTPIR